MQFRMQFCANSEFSSLLVEVAWNDQISAQNAQKWQILHGVTPKFHSVECVEFTSQIPIVYSENGIQWDTIISEFDIFDHFSLKFAQNRTHMVLFAVADFHWWFG